MNERATTLLGALAALLILIGLLYAPQQAPRVSRPVSAEAGGNGYLGLSRWLQQSGINTLSYRQRMKHLDSDPRLPRTGNIMISTMPHLKPVRAEELASIRTWIAAGNTLLVLAALDDSPDWILTTPSENLLEEIRSLTGLSFEAFVDDDGDSLLVGEVLGEYQHRFSPLAQHPMMEGIESMQAVSDSITSIWYPRLWETQQFVVRLATEDEYESDALWQLPFGEGQVIVSASGSLLSNRMLGQADNARFVENLLAWHLQSGASVIFDDIHQGISDLYDPEDFFADERLHNTLWVLLAFWLVYLLGGSARLAPLRDPSTTPQQADLVAAIGGFMTRKLSHSEAGRAMVEGWLAELRRSGHLQGSDSWQQLADMPLVDPGVLQDIQDSYRRLGQGDKVDLKKLHDNILTLKRIMA